MIMWVFLVLILTGLNLYAPAGPTIAQGLLANAIILVCAWGIHRWRRSRSDEESGFLPVLLFVYAVFFPLPIFTLQFYNYKDPFSPISVGDTNLEKALALILVGIVALLAGYYCPIRTYTRKNLPKIYLPWNNTKLVARLAIGIGLVSIAAFAITTQMHLDDSMQAWINLPSEFVFVATITLVVLQLQGKLSWTSTFVLWGLLIPVRLILGMAQGVFAQGLAVVVGLVVAYATVRHKVPWILLFAGIAGFCVLQPLKGAMRQQVWVGGNANPELAASDKLEALSLLPTRGLAMVEMSGLSTMVSIASTRLADVILFAHIISYTPNEVPYWSGETYAPFLTLPIPRLLYPDKPHYQPGNVLGHRYDLLPLYDYTTSINVPQLVELYLNFGPLALVLGGFLIGVLYRIINDSFVYPGAGFGSLVGGIFILSRLADVENAAIWVFGANFLMGLIVLAIFHVLIRFAEAFASALSLQRVRVSPG